MQNRSTNKEIVFAPLGGYLMLLVSFLLLAGVAASIAIGVSTRNELWITPAVVSALAFFLTMPGFFIVDPNVGRALVLFGKYRGTVREAGFYWTNPFTSKRKISLRAHNLNGNTLKVNDLLGNPVEIAAVVVWQVQDSAQALFDVEQFEHFVQVQSEAAIRLVASRHPYDDGQVSEITTTLRGSAEAVAKELAAELKERLAIAGIQVLEARLSHLAYAPEIAHAMLQRQQATAIIAARQMIVDGAVGMVELALTRLSERNVLHLDDERKATLVGNLLVVLCGNTNPTPVVNTGSLYT